MRPWGNHSRYDAFGRLAVEYGTTEASGTRYLTGDHLGSTRVVVDLAGVIQKCYDYLPFWEALRICQRRCKNPHSAGRKFPTP